MPNYANIQTPSRSDGITYAASVPLTSTEADLYNAGATNENLDPIPVLYGQAIQAVVTLVPQGGPVSLNAYVVMQTDLGDGVWIDVAWCVSTERQAQSVFLLAGGIAGNNAFQQSRQPGQFPVAQSSGSNAMALGGRIRFVGKSILGGQSSAAPGNPWQVAVSIKYKILGLN